MENVNRLDLKHNFLKEIIVRMDYVGIVQMELDGIISEIKNVLIAKGYKRFEREFATELDLQLEDPEDMEITSLPVKEVRKQSVNVFIDDNKKIQLKISPLCIFISTHCEHYIEFNEYANNLMEIVNLLKKEITFFNPVRFGIRKINKCIISDICLINDFFKEKYYSPNKRTKVYQVKDCYEDGKDNVNFIRTVIKGMNGENIAYQVVLDTDIYVYEQEEIEKLMNDSSEIQKMNEKLFEIYKSVLTEEFLVKLQQNIFDLQGIEGVENNG